MQSKPRGLSGDNQSWTRRFVLSHSCVRWSGVAGVSALLESLCLHPKTMVKPGTLATTQVITALLRMALVVGNRCAT